MAEEIIENTSELLPSKQIYNEATATITTRETRWGTVEFFLQGTEESSNIEEYRELAFQMLDFFRNGYIPLDHREAVRNRLASYFSPEEL